MEPFLNIEKASRFFGGHKAVDHVSFNLAEDALCALIGPNGAGKTTLFNLISGALPLSQGVIRMRGQRVSDVESACAFGIARTFQNVRLFHEMTVLDNVMTAMGDMGFLKGSFPWMGRDREERLRLKRAWYLLEDMGIASLAGESAAEIPFGQQRLVEVARAMAMQPKLLLLDEPAAGLNGQETAALSRIVRSIHRKGIAVLLVEHDMSLVMGLAERVLVLDQGRLIFDGSPTQSRSDPAVCAAYLGKEACGC
jgi:branched-chain amino acid transport system ATP-binding protein